MVESNDLGVTAAIALGGLLFVGAMWKHQNQRSSNGRPPLRRKVSFTSVGLAKGTFPPSCNVPPPIANGAAYCQTAPKRVNVVQQVVEPLLQYQRFSHVLDIDNSVFRPSTQSYTADDLVREITVKGDDSVTTNTILEHMQDDLHQGRSDLPWWEVLVIRNNGRGKSAMVLRVHHALADGIALVHAFWKILKQENGEPLTMIQPPKKPSPKYSWWSFVQSTIEVLTLGASKFDDNTAFSKCNQPSMKHSRKRTICVLPTVSLEFIKALKTAAGGTVNDVLLAAVSQAIYDFCKQQDDTVLSSKTQCRALLPVGFPRSAESLQDPSTAMTNKWCLVSCDIAVNESHVLNRIKAITKNSSRLKSNPIAFMQLAIQNCVAPLLPNSLARQSVIDVFSRHSLVLTNVPGPPQPCRMAGVVVQDLHVLFDNLLTQTNLISYAGKVFGNVIYDPEALPALDGFGRLYGEALVKMAKALDVDPPKELLSS